MICKILSVFGRYYFNNDKNTVDAPMRCTGGAKL